MTAKLATGVAMAGLKEKQVINSLQQGCYEETHIEGKTRGPKVLMVHSEIGYVKQHIETPSNVKPFRHAYDTASPQW